MTQSHQSAFRNPSTRAALDADAELLAGFEAYVFAALRHDAGGAGAAADDRADDGAAAAARDPADDRADACARSDLRHVVLRAAPAAHAALRVNLADVRVARGQNLDDLRAERLPVAAVRHLYLVEAQLQHGRAARPAGPAHLGEATADDCARQVPRLDDAGLEAVADLAHVGGESALKLDEKDGVAGDVARAARRLRRRVGAAAALRDALVVRVLRVGGAFGARGAASVGRLRGGGA